LGEENKTVEYYDAWTQVGRWPVLGYSTVTGNEVVTLEAAQAKFGDRLREIKELLEAMLNNPLVAALLKAYLGL